MDRMRERLYKVFLSGFEDADYLTKARVKFLFILESIIVVFFGILHVLLLLADTEAFLRTIRVTPILLVGLVASLAYLRRGNFSTAANALLAGFTLTLMNGLINEALGKSHLAYHTYIFFIFSVMAYCTVFCTAKVLTITTASLALTDIAVFAIVRGRVDKAFLEGSFLAFNDSLFSLIFVFIVSYLTIRIFNHSVELAGREADRNLKQTDFIRTVVKSG